jgi:molecular chaperone GrpE
MLRAQAECANITKRLTQDRAEAVKLAGMGLARALLAVLDNFERTLANLREAHAEDPVIAGVKLIADQLAKVLKDHGVEPIESVGKPFDPMYHEALMHDRQAEAPPGTITQELERGYTMHGRVLRHAKVAVGAAPTDGDGEKDAPEPGK